MSTLSIGAVTAQDIIDKFDNDFRGNCFGDISVKIMRDPIGVAAHYFYIIKDGYWVYCLEVTSNGNNLFTNDTSLTKRDLPFFNTDDFESIKADFIETFYALCHFAIPNPLLNSRGQVRRKTIENINTLLGTLPYATQSLALWYKLVRREQLQSGYQFITSGYFRNTIPYGRYCRQRQFVTGYGGVNLPNFVLQNLGYVYLRDNEWAEPPSVPNQSDIPSKYLRLMNYSTRVPNELGFKTVSDKAGKFNDKFKKYYQEYVASLNSNSTPEYNPLAPVYLGLELEFELVDEDDDRDEVVASDIMPKVYPHGVCKSDGSLSYGIELVTVPAVYEEHVKSLDEFFSDFPDSLCVERSCGLHIHVSRAPFNLPTQGRLIAFMNNPSNAKFLENIGDREFNSYSKQDTSRSVATILRGGGDRYNVLNLNNKATLEFRLFKGTKNFTTVKRSMQFCLAICEYCKNLTMPIKEFIKHENFVEWLKTQRKVYPELADKLAPRKPIPQQYIKQQTESIV